MKDQSEVSTQVLRLVELEAAVSGPSARTLDELAQNCWQNGLFEWLMDGRVQRGNIFLTTRSRSLLGKFLAVDVAGREYSLADGSRVRVKCSGRHRQRAWRFDRIKARAARPVLQDWVLGLPFMQQTVLLTAIRGPDGIAKYAGVKMLLRWYRRCVLLSAMDGRVLDNPVDEGGGSFTGPSVTLQKGEELPWESAMSLHVDNYLREIDAMPHHFHMHLMHAVEIVGYKHSDPRIRKWWCAVYLRLVNDGHLHPESEQEMDERLGDTRAGWLRRADPATAA